MTKVKVLTKAKEFYKSNGIVGITYKKLKTTVPNVFEIRAGSISNNSLAEFDERKKKKPLTTKQKVENILTDNEISETQKDPFSAFYQEQYEPNKCYDLDFESRRQWWQARADNFQTDPKFKKLKNSLLAKSQYRLYCGIKSKLPTLIFLPLTNAELKRLAVYRMLGFSSAPFTIGAYLGFSLPCAVAFSMLEMYVPDKFKLPCKVFKWTGGGLYYGVSYTIDHLTKGLEKKHFGNELPIDAQQTMGTIPTTADMSELYEWSKEFFNEYSKKTG